MSQRIFNVTQLLFNFSPKPQFSFTSFIRSEGSCLAFEAAQKISTDKYPPFISLFIAAGQGLGKTHLLHAIANQAIQNGSVKSVSYIAGSEWVHQTQTESRENYSFISEITSTDLLLLDDVHEISGYPLSQEKLHFVFNILKDHQKRMVFAGTRPPDELEGIEDFLKSRFQWGLVTPLKPIDDDTTAKIIQKLGKDLDLEIPDKIVTYLIERIARDFPSIQNTVNKVNRTSYIKKRKVTIPLVKEALGL